MIYEDKNGHLIMPEELDEMAAWEIEDLGVHVSHGRWRSNRVDGEN